MSAGRSASSLLFTLIATIVLFGLFAAISTLDPIEKHAYKPAVGWTEPNDTASGIHGVCAPSSVTSGFPLADSRQAALPDNCQKAKNSVAHALNFALYFAVAGIISVGAVESMRARLP